MSAVKETEVASRMGAWFVQLPILVLALLSLCSCDGRLGSITTTINETDYQQAVTSAVSGSGYAGQFNRIFPGAKNTISYFDGRIGPSKWSSSIGLHGRYVLLITCPISLNGDRTKIVSEGHPDFYLYELPRIKDEGGGQYYFEVNQFERGTLPLEAWEKLVEAGGDFSAVGIILETNKPVANFEAAWRNFK